MTQAKIYDYFQKVDYVKELLINNIIGIMCDTLRYLEPDHTLKILREKTAYELEDILDNYLDIKSNIDGWL